MLHSEEKMLTRISAVSGGSQRKLIIGASPYRSKSIFLEAIKIFYEKVNNCTIVMYEKPYAELLNILDSGKIDLIADRPQPDTIQYTSIHIADERIFIAADKKYAFNIIKDGEYPSIMLSDILDKPFIIIDNTMYIGATTRSIFAQCNVIPNIVMECQSVETAHIMVTSKIGISLIPEMYIKFNNKSPDINYYIIADMPLSREIAAVYRNDRHLSEDGRIFIEILRNQFS
jgi:DNA-binding transcriptional LysR family regulator